jgi:hypothetical protein
VFLGGGEVLKPVSEVLKCLNPPREVIYHHARFGRNRCKALEMCEEETDTHALLIDIRVTSDNEQCPT